MKKEYMQAIVFSIIAGAFLGTVANIALSRGESAEQFTRCVHEHSVADQHPGTPNERLETYKKLCSEV